MRNRSIWLAAAVLGLGLGFSVSYAPPADASRNASGSYSLPSGNPVVAGTAITASHMNTTLADIGTELTNSLDRSGRGAMVAPLQLSSGTSSAPSLTFSSEATSGLYRAGAGDLRMQVSSTQTQKWTSSGVTFPLAVTTQGGVTSTASTANGSALTATGNGSGAGLVATGGSSSGTGVVGTGAGAAGFGGAFTGTGTAPGLSSTGGTGGGNGANFTGGGSSGNGLVATGAGGGVGGLFTAGTAATAATRQSALQATNGDITFGGSNPAPSSTTAVSRSLTPKNLVAAWAKMTTGASPAVVDGFNIASVSRTASRATLTFASAFANADFACTATSHTLANPAFIVITGQTTTTVEVAFYEAPLAGTGNPTTTTYVFSIVCTGAQ
jgi:hypothetical protein